MSTTKKPRQPRKTPKKQKPPTPKPAPDPLYEHAIDLMVGPTTHNGESVRVVAISGGHNQPLMATLLHENDETTRVPAADLTITTSDEEPALAPTD